MIAGRRRRRRSGSRAVLGSIGPIAATLALHFAVSATLTWAVAPLLTETYVWRPFSSRDLRTLMGTWGAVAGGPALVWAVLAVVGAAVLRRRSPAWFAGSAAFVAVAASFAAVLLAAVGGAPAPGGAIAAVLLVPASAATTLVGRAIRARAPAPA